MILPGVQVLFAFLITAPFSGRFGELDDAQRILYAVALAASTAALLVLQTPVAYHHLSDRHSREERIDVAIRLKLIGLALLGVAITTALAAVAGFVFNPNATAVAAGACALGAASLWVLFPLAGRHLRS